jgi:hypothetical protein
MEDILNKLYTPEHKDYPDNLYMEEAPKQQKPLAIEYPINLPMEIQRDPNPPEPPALPKKATSPLSSGGGGGYFPLTKTRKTPKKEIPPPVQPKMKVGGLDKLQEYNQDFKHWQLRLVGHVLDNKETIKAYAWDFKGRSSLYSSETAISSKKSRPWQNGNKQQKELSPNLRRKWDRRALLKRQNWLGCRFKNSRKLQYGIK